MESDTFFLIKNYQGKNFLFHSKLIVKQKLFKKFPKFYQKSSTTWAKFLSSLAKVLSIVKSIWYNESMKNDNNTIFNRYFSQKTLNHISDLLENNGKMRSWKDLRAKLDLDDNRKLYWIQVIHTILRAWKEMILECGNNISNLIIHE